MGDSIKFWIEGVPVPKGRPRTGRSRDGRVVHFTPAKTKVYEELVKLRALSAVKRQGWPVDRGPKLLSLEFALPIPRSWSKRQHEAATSGAYQPTGVPDLDNLVKAVKDGLNGVAWLDDAQVVELVCSKRYAAAPGVQVQISDATLNP